LGLVYIRLSSDPRRVNRLLDWTPRVHGGLQDPYPEPDADDAGDEA
jgi:hypothetical protein